MKKISIVLYFTASLLLMPLKSNALDFGQNAFRVEKHKWFIAETEHFKVFHYPESKDSITGVTKLAEEAFNYVTDKMNYRPSKKIPFFYYISQNHFEQNNIANAEGAGGFTEALKNRMVLPADSSQRRMRHVVYHEFTHDVCFYIWYDNPWKTISLLKSVFYPLWIIEGVAEYVSAHYDDLSYADMVLRDAVISSQLLPLTNLQNFGPLRGYQVYLAYKESESAIRYIAEKYGADTVNDIISMYRESIDVNSVLSRTIKNNLSGLNSEWEDYLKDKYNQAVENKNDAELYGDKLTGNNENNTCPVFSPDGRKLAFISNRNGYNDVFITNKNGTVQYPLLKWRIGFSLDNVYSEGHALSWSADGRKIAFTGRKKYQEFICIFDVRSRKLKKIPVPLDSVSSPCFSPDGKMIAFTGIKNAKSDIWLYNIVNNSLKKLTDDEYDDDNSVFSPDGGRIVYVSEHDLQKDLFIINLKDNRLIRLTETQYYEINPAWSPDGSRVYYVSDADGCYNIYRMDDSGTNIEKLTDVKTGIFNPELSRQGDELAFVYYRRGEKNIYTGELMNIKPLDKVSIPVPPLENTPEKKKEELTYNKPDEISLVNDIKKYKSKLLTDIFLPAGFIDTNYGLYLFGLWYLSDMLGNNNLQLQLAYSSDWYTGNKGFFDGQLAYIYKGLKPDLGIYYSGSRSMDSLNNYVSVYRETLMMDYPLDRFNRVSIAGGVFNGIKTDTSNNVIDDYTYTYNLAALSFVRDTTQGKLLDVLSGFRANITFEKSLKIFGGDYDYLMSQIEVQKYITVRNYGLNDYHVLALRFWCGLIQGQNRNLADLQFNIDDASMLRGDYSELETGNKFGLFNAELRLMIMPELNYHMWYFWPDFYIKNLQMVLFLDSGRTWKDGDLMHGIQGFNTSVGIGARLNVFLIEQYPLVLRLDYAAHINDFSKKRISLSLGPTF